MLHSNSFKSLVILMQKPVYRDLPVGKLEESSILVRNMLVPHQQGFYSDSKACLSVGIDYLPAFALEYGIIGRAMPISQSTAMAAPLACVPTIHNIKSNSFVKTPAYEQLPKFVKRNTHNFSVEPFVFRGEPFEVLNGNISIISNSHICNFLNNFSKPIPDKIPFFCLEPIEASPCSATSSISQTLQDCPSFKYLPAPMPDVFSEICLCEDFAFRGENGHSEAFAVDVDAQNSFPLGQFTFLFGEIGNYLSVGSKPISFAYPTRSNEAIISLEISVIANWHSNVLLRIHSEFHKESAFGAEGFAIAGNVELNGNCLDCVASVSDDIAFNITNHLAVEGSGFFAD